MKLTYLFVLGCLLGLVGCQAPSNSSTPVKEASLPAPISTNRVQKPVRIDPQAFTVITSTNQLDPQWLRMPTNFYRLGPGDVIEIEMLSEITSRSSAVVGPDGKIYFGLLPGTFVWGLSLAEAKGVLDEGLKTYFREQPQVGLTLRTVASQRVWILGQVQAPGVYPLETPLTLLEAISRAGGTAVQGAASGPSEGDLQNSFVMRQGKLLGVDFYRLFRRGDLSQNIYLQADDLVYVRPTAEQVVYVLGAVARSGAIPFVDRISLVSAVASAGSTVPYAQFSEVAIIRGSLSNPSVATVNYKAIVKGVAPNVLLEPGDIVYVPFSPYRQISELADHILKQFVSTVALNEGIRAVNGDAPPVGISVGLSTGVSAPAP